jgi:DNA-directed RNA polymerase specialized sigma24 family protein
MAREIESHLHAFPATQWSLIERARQIDGTAGREALSLLLRRYLPALRAHLITGKRLPASQTEDVLQGFVADKIIEQNLLEHASKGRGKFRSFLLVTLDHYAISQHRNESAAKRSPELGVAELHENATHLTGGHDPAEQFNIAWARELIAEALRRMEAECIASQRDDLWKIFKGRVLQPAFEGQAPMEYAELVQELGLAAPLEACQLLTTAKRMFARNLRAVAAEYAGADGDAEAEVDDLRNILSVAGAQSGRPSRNYQ